LIVNKLTPLQKYSGGIPELADMVLVVLDVSRV